MTRVLLVGYDPETVDYSNPALPPGMSAEKIRAGLTLGLKQMTDRGWEADLCLVSPNETAGKTVERHLAGAHYACRNRGRYSPATSRPCAVRGSRERGT